MIKTQTEELLDLVAGLNHLPISKQFLERLSKGNPTRDENPESHFCVYFVAFDPKEEKIFTGLHKKSNLWLVNGGHLDKEPVKNAAPREMGEEWGYNLPDGYELIPQFLTIANITDRPQIKCRTHYDFWTFVPVNMHEFSPDQEKLASEYHKTAWLSFEEAKKVTTDPSNLLGFDFIKKYLLPTKPKPLKLLHIS